MITPGWRRRNNSCPQCHMSGQISDRYKGQGILRLLYGKLRIEMQVMVDVCDQCGILYASKADAVVEGAAI